MIKSIDDFNFSGKKVLIRVDFNVPLDKELNITDDIRIVSSLASINKIIADGGIPILLSHLGRPDGQVIAKYSLKPVADYLQNKCGYKVHFAYDCIGDIAKNAVNSAKIGDIVLLENLRFHSEEEANDIIFAKELANLGDCYVNDAFGTAHRAHASTFEIAMNFKDKFCGYLIYSELKYLGEAVDNPIRPFVAVIGGSKISGKIDVINNLLSKCDYILIGGGMVFTFYKAMGLEIGKSLLENDRVEMAKDLIAKAKEMNVNLLLPTDILVADKFDNDANTKIVKKDEIGLDDIGMDIGTETQKSYSEIISKAKTIIWNGPMGVFEMPNFSKGTYSIACSLAEATLNGGKTIVGGGDSAAAIKQINFEKKVCHVSTGGGASLEYLEGKKLPGIIALEI